MLVREIVEQLGLTVFSGKESLDKPVNGGIVSDILSDVMAQAHKGEIWVTNQTHENVLAIVFFKSLAGVILPNGHCLDEEAAKKAVEKKIPVFLTDLSAFEVVGRLYSLGIGNN